MATADLMIDYDEHPGFNSSVRCWPYNLELLNRFNCLYEELKTGRILADPAELLEIHDLTFSLFRVTSNDYLADAFVSELHEKVAQEIKSHIKFFTGIAKSTKKTPSFNFRTIQRGVIKGELSSLSLTKIANLTTIEIQKLTHAASLGKNDRESLSQNSGVRIRRLIQHLNREFKANGILGKLSQNHASSIKVVGAAIELSVPQASWWSHADDSVRAPKTLYAHLDEGINAPKAIIYLSNVSTENGPFSYFPRVFDKLDLTGYQDLIGRCITSIGSSIDSPLYQEYGSGVRRTSAPLFRQHFMKLPPEYRFNSHFGWDVLSGSALEALMIEDERVVVGQAGTFMVFDGAQIVHRGGIVQNDRRIAIQVVFGDASLRVSIIRFLRSCRRKLQF
jgi:hypothetical protein